MKALDLFCGGGGASEGLARAGFDVTGVDIRPRKSYPYDFRLSNALEFDLRGYDFIWASPPCQGYSAHVTSSNSAWVPYSQGMATPRLIADVRRRLMMSGVPFAIENVMGARRELVNPVQLCGSMFGLPIPRHRLIETSFAMLVPLHQKCSGMAKAYSVANGIDYRDMTATGKSRRAGCLNTWSRLLGVAHRMTASELAESIPPAYAEFVAKSFMGMSSATRECAA